MSAMETRGSRLPDEARFELAAAAGAAERRNRPAWLVWAALLLLVIVLLLAAFALASRARAEARLRRSLADQAQVEQMAVQWRALSEMERQNPSQDVGAPMENLASTLESLATRAGFQTVPLTPSPQVDTRQGLTIRNYFYSNHKERSVGAILEWLRMATQDPTTRIPGLEVDSLSLRPVDEGKAWSMTLRLRRWERAT